MNLTFDTTRLSIRPIKAEDWQALQKIWLDQSQSAYAAYDNPKNLNDEAVREMVKRWATHQSREHILLAVCLKDENVIGFVNFHLHDSRYEISYGFMAEYQGKGYAREAVSAILEVLHKEGINSFSAGTGLKNIPSVRLLKAVGFKQTGTEKVSFYKDSDGNDIYFDGGIYELDLI